MKIFNILLFAFLLTSTNVNAQSFFEKLKKIFNTEASGTSTNSPKTLSNLSTTDISKALKEALNLGVEEGVKKLGVADGFYKNELVKILLPEQLRNVDKTLRSIGLGNMADEGLKLLNRAAENAVSESLPIFSKAITSITFDDAKNILLGDKNAATSYLQKKTAEQLFTAFKPKVEESLGVVGADKVWTNLITKYNTIAVNKINTDLNAYVTEQAINGVFKMVAQKEAGIRDNVAMRTSSILQEVFGAINK